MKKKLDINSQEYRDIVEKLLNKTFFNIYKDSRRVETYYIGDSPIIQEDSIVYPKVTKPIIKKQVYYGLVKDNKLSHLNNMEEIRKQKTKEHISVYVYEKYIVENFYKDK